MPLSTRRKLGNIWEYSPTGEYLKAVPNFKKCMCCKKYLKDNNKHNSLYLTLKICFDIITSLDIICSLKLTVFLELRSRKTVRFLGQILSADKCPSIFSYQMEAIVYLDVLVCSITTTWLPQMVECQSVWEIEGSSPRPDQHTGS